MQRRLHGQSFVLHEERGFWMDVGAIEAEARFTVVFGWAGKGHAALSFLLAHLLNVVSCVAALQM